MRDRTKANGGSVVTSVTLPEFKILVTVILVTLELTVSKPLVLPMCTLHKHFSAVSSFECYVWWNLRAITNQDHSKQCVSDSFGFYIVLGIALQWFSTFVLLCVLWKQIPRK